MATSIFDSISCDCVTIVLSDKLYDNTYKTADITGYKDGKVVGHALSDTYSIKGPVFGDFEVSVGGLKLWSNRGDLKVVFANTTYIEA